VTTVNTLSTEVPCPGCVQRNGAALLPLRVLFVPAVFSGFRRTGEDERRSGIDYLSALRLRRYGT
jgi:hypothetical protein